MRVLVVFGTRPEAIKMAPLVKALQRNSAITVKTCVTAQHRQMLDQVLELFEIVPDYDLNIMKPGQTLSMVTSEIVLKIEGVINDFTPDLMLVHGDTSTSFSAALAAFYHRVPVGHVEAGLRTGNIYSPWPEEGNRKLTAAIAQMHFAPTVEAQANLIAEGVRAERIVVTGNTVIDALFWVREKLHNAKAMRDELERRFGYLRQGARLILITAHRRENFGEGFLSICTAIRELAEKYPEVDFIYPVHLNPNVQKPVRDVLSGVGNVHLCDPLDYLPFVYLMIRSYMILTDSGGIQEEAPALGKPVLLMRDTTERPEAVDAGTVKLVGTSRQIIVNAVSELLEVSNAYEAMSQAQNPYGRGDACVQIVSALIESNNFSN